VTGVVATLLALGWALGLRGLDVPTLWAVLYGAGLAAVNTIVAHALVLWSRSRSTNVFMGMILGGMMGRMAIMLAAVVAGILWLELPRLPLAISLLSFFTLFLIMEITILHRQTPALTGAGR
jgi:hypothetical protein